MNRPKRNSADLKCLNCGALWRSVTACACWCSGPLLASAENVAAAALVAEARGEVHRPDDVRKIRLDLADALEASNSECARLRGQLATVNIRAIGEGLTANSPLAESQTASDVQDSLIFGSGSVLGAIASGEVNGYRYIMQLKALVDQMQAEIDRATVDGGELLLEIGRLRAKLARVEEAARCKYLWTDKGMEAHLGGDWIWLRPIEAALGSKTAQAIVDAARKGEPAAGAEK